MLPCATNGEALPRARLYEHEYTYSTCGCSEPPSVGSGQVASRRVVVRVISGTSNKSKGKSELI